ncbi:DUF63 family protein [Salinarchaeum chitinilyticum]
MNPSVVVGAVGPGTFGGTVLQLGGVLPDGFGLPPLPYVAALLLGLLTVGALLWTLSPPVTNATVVALTPWMMTGGVLHALHQVREFPDWAAPLFGTPAVYATVAVVAGFIWVMTTLYSAMTQGSPNRHLGVIGTGVVVTFTMLGLIEAFQNGTLDALPVAVTIAATGIAAAITWAIIGVRFTDSAALASWTGMVVVAAHALDGVSTAVGYDMLDVHERSPASEAILEAGSALPTAEFIGAGWLFVLVKLLVASVIVVLFREWLREEPQEARLALAAVAALGLGPGMNNVILFAVSG